MSFLFRICFCIFTLCWYTGVFANFYISEVFPNTTDDKNLEYIKITYAGTATGNLDGFILEDKSGKQYTIPETSIIGQESYVFSRLDTKLVLNNTSEEIFLKNPEEKIIDTVSYTRSEKGVPLIFSQPFQEMIISDESRLNIFFSDEADIFPVIFPVDEISVIETIRWDLQRPSYVLDSTSSADTYDCDTDKEECKINFTFLPSFSEGSDSSDYICNTSFGFISGQENRCNPNTIIFPEGIHQVHIKIQHKDDPSLFLEDSFSVRNLKKLEPLDTQIQENTPENTSETSDSIFLPPINYTLQIPSYVHKNSSNVFVCDTSREICKINFDLRPSFIGNFKESDYICVLDFGFATSESEKCNPNIIEVPVGEHLFEFRIYHKNFPEIHTKHSLQVVNTGYIPGSSSGTSPKKTDIEKPVLPLMQPHIQVQSGLNSDYICTTQPCKINLKYEKNFGDERCLWNFGNATYKQSTLTRCNPGYVEYSPGIHDIILRVYQKDNTENFKETTIRIRSGNTKPHTQEEKNQETIYESQTLKIHNIDFALQGRATDFKSLSGSVLECFTDDICSINVTSQTSFSGSLKDVSYYWDLGNGEVFEGPNPLSQKYEIGEYRVKLSVVFQEQILYEKYLNISVIDTKKSPEKGEEVPKNEEKIFSGDIRISTIYPNPVGRDIKEWIQLENFGSETSLDGCYLKRGSVKYRFSESDIFPSQQTLRVHRSDSYISLPNTSGTVELRCYSQLIDSFSWDEKIPEGYVLSRDGAVFKYIFRQEDYVSQTSFVNIRILKSGVKIYGEAFPNSSVQLSSNQGHDFSLVVDESGVFQYTLSTGFSSGDIQFSALFSVPDGEEYILESDTKTLSGIDILNFLPKPKKIRTKKQSQEDIPVLLISQNLSGAPIKNLEISVQKHMFFLLGILGIIFVCSVYVLYLYTQYSVLLKNTISISVLLFQTRQKVNVVI